MNGRTESDEKGGGDVDDLEARLAAIEAKLEQIESYWLRVIAAQTTMGENLATTMELLMKVDQKVQAISERLDRIGGGATFQ